MAVMFHLRFPLSPATVEDAHKRGMKLSHEAMWFRMQCFGPVLAAEIGKTRVSGLHASYGRWHLNEVFVKASGVSHQKATYPVVLQWNLFRLDRS
ncbi:hypothetical protein FHG66_03785 [Rubellimicrobium rubrum]|uniref:Uncharacterized protein n=1 Tax=Rubellimicrobium rubrum TaxID=2585369 RepID=A0A5C4N4J3_9RHOB|nr:hypothetical protein [Rubellimicrobium rubrum]TNC51938.1 hypothetical protein FHG66_03785 [Rubellimicrobium rubrum]